jgi:histone H3/H4
LLLFPIFSPSIGFKPIKEGIMAKETLVVVSKVKDYVKGKGCQTSETAVEALSDAVRELLDKAVARSKDNGRQTVKDRDI